MSQTTLGTFNRPESKQSKPDEITQEDYNQIMAEREFQEGAIDGRDEVIDEGDLQDMRDQAKGDEPSQEPPSELARMHPRTHEGFSVGQRVQSVAGEIYTVTELYENSMTVRDENGLDFDGLFETFRPVNEGVD